MDMGIIAYVFFAYGLTAIISIFVVAIIVLINRLMMRGGK